MSRPKYSWKPKSTKKAKTQTLFTSKAAKDYKNVMYDFGRAPRKPKKVKEYQQPAAMFTKSCKIKNLGYRNSEEGIHVGSNPVFDGKARRQAYKNVTVEFDGLYCDYYGEDAFIVDPLGKAVVRKAQWKGRADSAGSDHSGGDKCIQVDGGRLELRGKRRGDVLIENAVRAVRGKANSIIIIDSGDFVKCKTCVKGDGMRNPPSKSAIFFNGKPGKCLILIRNCRFWDCKTLVDIDKDCIVYWEKSNKVMSGDKSKSKMFKKRTGGKLVEGSALNDKFKAEWKKMKARKSNAWKV
ncbi:MAG: hypothetical protein AAF585_29525 [Verrucomicrobiota bacterium]